MEKAWRNMCCFLVLAHSHFTAALLMRTGFRRRLLETMKIKSYGHRNSKRIISTPFSPSAVDVKQPGFVVKASLKVCWTQLEIAMRRL